VWSFRRDIVSPPYEFEKCHKIAILYGRYAIFHVEAARVAPWAHFSALN